MESVQTGNLYKAIKQIGNNGIGTLFLILSDNYPLKLFATDILVVEYSYHIFNLTRGTEHYPRKDDFDYEIQIGNLIKLC